MVLRWIKLCLEFAVSQGIGQTAGMLSGLIYVRLMPVDQYALYAISMTALGFILTTSDIGGGALNYFWHQKVMDGSIITAVSRLRLVLLIIASLIVGPLLLKTALKQNINTPIMLSCFGLAIATAWNQMHGSIGINLLRLQKLQRQSYYCELAGSIMRLLAAIAMLVMGITTALFGLAGQLLGAGSTLVALRRYQQKLSSPTQAGMWRQLFTYIMLTAPSMIVYIVEGPLILWLAMTFGGTAPISETFAVGRISAIYAVITSFTLAVVAPRLASVHDDAHFTRIVIHYFFCLVLLGGAGLMIANLMPSVLLLLIGDNYAHLQSEVILSIGIVSVGQPTAFLATVNNLRGWVRLDPAIALCQVMALFILASQWSFQDAASVFSLMLTLTIIRSLCILMISIVGLTAPRLVAVRCQL